MRPRPGRALLALLPVIALALSGPAAGAAATGPVDLGPVTGHRLANAPAWPPTWIDLALSPTGNGYWVLDRYGRVATEGAASTHDAIPLLEAGERAVAIEADQVHDGYLVVTDRGRVLAAGEAVDHGDLAGVALNAPIIDAAVLADGSGYYLVGADGGVFTFGAATFHGSTGDLVLNAPVNSLVPDPDGGYWLVADDGGVFSFDAEFRGSTGDIVLNAPVVGAAGTGAGYLLFAADGGVFVFSDAGFWGSLGDDPPDSPVTAVAVADDRYLVLEADGTPWEFTAERARAAELSGRPLDRATPDAAVGAVAPLQGEPTRLRSSRWRSYAPTASAAWLGTVPRAEHLTLTSTADGTAQRAWFSPPRQRGAPVLVYLHSWSVGYESQVGIPLAEWAARSGWAVIAPDFRGRFDDAEATASDLAVADVVDAVAYALARGGDPERVYVTGFSGGAMMTLVMAGRHPELFAGAAAWVGIHDLAWWYRLNRARNPTHHYTRDIERACGGQALPGTAAEAECRRRSPIAHLDRARQAGLPVYLGHGLGDGNVPASESVRAFNQLADEADRFGPDEIASIEAARLPPALVGELAPVHRFGPGDPEPLLARSSAEVTLVLFDGRHEILYGPAMRWFDQLAHR